MQFKFQRVSRLRQYSACPLRGNGLVVGTERLQEGFGKEGGAIHNCGYLISGKSKRPHVAKSQMWHFTLNCSLTEMPLPFRLKSGDSVEYVHDQALFICPIVKSSVTVWAQCHGIGDGVASFLSEPLIAVLRTVYTYEHCRAGFSPSQLGRNRPNKGGLQPALFGWGVY